MQEGVVVAKADGERPGYLSAEFDGAPRSWIVPPQNIAARHWPGESWCCPVTWPALSMSAE
jgi:hypothetical protein